MCAGRGCGHRAALTVSYASRQNWSTGPDHGRPRRCDSGLGTQAEAAPPRYPRPSARGRLTHARGGGAGAGTGLVRFLKRSAPTIVVDAEPGLRRCVASARWARHRPGGVLHELGQHLRPRQKPANGTVAVVRKAANSGYQNQCNIKRRKCCLTGTAHPSWRAQARHPRPWRGHQGQSWTPTCVGMTKGAASVCQPFGRLV